MVQVPGAAELRVKSRPVAPWVTTLMAETVVEAEKVNVTVPVVVEATLTLPSARAGAVAWAWGMNGLFTVVGGLLSMLLSLRYGFNFALSFALCLYGVAFIVYRPLRDAKMEEAPISDQAGLASPSRPAL